MIHFAGIEMPLESDLRLVRIFFDTATFDDIERDKKIKAEAQLSLIGGTMGLFSGFSIISGIEIIFFLAKFTYKLFANCKQMYFTTKDENTATTENDMGNEETTMHTTSD